MLKSWKTPVGVMSESGCVSSPPPPPPNSSFFAGALGPILPDREVDWSRYCRLLLSLSYAEWVLLPSQPALLWSILSLKELTSVPECHPDLLSDGHTLQCSNKTLVPIAGFNRDGNKRVELKSAQGKRVVVKRMVYFMMSESRAAFLNVFTLEEPLK
jgi:hypothetical protein